MIDPDPTPTIMRAQRAEEHLKVDDKLMTLLGTYHAIVLRDDDFAEKLTWLHTQPAVLGIFKTNRMQLCLQ
jgi:hypothetical protein